MAHNGTASGQNGGHRANSTDSDSGKLSPGSPPEWDNSRNGMTPAILPVYSSKEDSHGRVQWQTEIPEGLGGPPENADTENWAIIVRHDRVWGDPEKTLSVHSIVIQSPLLKELLGEVLQGYPGVTVNMKRLVFTGWCEPLIHRWHDLQMAIEAMSRQLKVGNGDARLYDRISHAMLLDGLLKKHFADIGSAIKDYLANGVITFQHLWTIFEPGIAVFTRSENQGTGLQLHSSRYVNLDPSPAYELTCSYVDFDGDRFATEKTIIYIPEFSGTKPIVGLQAFPLDLHGERSAIRAQLVERGRRFESLAGVHYCHYDGVGLFLHGSSGKDQLTIKGRVVIDVFGFNQANPDQASFFSPSKHLDPVEFTQLSRRPFGLFPDDENDASSRGVRGSDGSMPEDGGRRTDSGDDQDRPRLTENQMLICGPFMHGYALREKKWLSLCIDCLSEITFNELALSDLRLPDQQKDLVTGFASSNQPYWNDSGDLIEGKGRGVLVLLCGPPGVGKTLTAEAVAEKMRVPLFTLTPGDLGSDLTGIESRLQRLICMCDRWGATILVDEADVLLEARGRSEPERNKLVSILMRVVEHHEGIMFLTTSRAETFGPAFQSRIHISLQYPELDRECRKGIWETFLRRHDEAQAAAREMPAPTACAVAARAPAPKRAAKRSLSPSPPADPYGNGAAEGPALHRKLTQPHQVSDGEMDRLAELRLDGRQIKNFLKAAQLMATYKEEALGYRHIDTAVSVMQHFHKAKEANDEAYARAYS